MKDKPAFPQLGYEYMPGGGSHLKQGGGMTVREFAAIQAMQGLLASGPHDCSPAEIAHDAVWHADVILARLEQTEE